MKIAVLGAGAIGGLVAAHLVSSGHDVLVHARGDHGATMAIEGLRIEGVQSFTIAPKDWFVSLDEISMSVSELKCEMAIITSKAIHTDSLAKFAAKICDGPVLSLQNGLGNLEIISEILGPHRAFAAAITHGVIRLGPGRLQWAGKGEIIMEEDNPFFFLFQDSGLNPVCSLDIQGILWKKLLINAAINPLAAICGVKNGELLEESMFSQCLAVMYEAAVIGRIEGVDLPIDEELEVILRDVLENTAENECSMLQDVKSGRETEIEMICGQIVKRAERIGIDSPLNLMLLNQIRALR